MYDQFTERELADEKKIHSMKSDLQPDKQQQQQRAEQQRPIKGKSHAAVRKTGSDASSRLSFFLYFLQNNINVMYMTISRVAGPCSTHVWCKKKDVRLPKIARPVAAERLDDFICI